MRRGAIMAMPAGREMDALIAEEVMHTEKKTGKQIGFRAEGYEDTIFWNVGGNWSVDGPPQFSTDIAAAWEVIKKLPNGRFILELGARQASVEFQGYLNEKVTVDGAPEEVAPLAICRAALLAIIGE